MARSDRRRWRLLEDLGDVPVRFWMCPVREHGGRKDDRGWPVVTVEWRDDIAHCTAPGCTHTSADREGTATS